MLKKLKLSLNSVDSNEKCHPTLLTNLLTIFSNNMSGVGGRGHMPPDASSGRAPKKGCRNFLRHKNIQKNLFALLRGDESRYGNF